MTILNDSFEYAEDRTDRDSLSEKKLILNSESSWTKKLV